MKKTSIILVIVTSLLTVSVSFSQPTARKNAVFYNEKGWEYLAKSDYFRAVLAFRNALKQNPRYKEAIAGLAKTYLYTEAYEESLKLFSDVLNLDKNNIQAVTDSAFALARLGKYDDALKYLDTALKMDGENIDAKYYTAYIYYLMDKIIWSKRLLNGILLVNPYHYNSLLLMADIKLRENRDKEAEEYIRKAIDSDQEKPEAYVKYGLLMMKVYKYSQNRDDLTDAVEKFNRALAINQENLYANRNLGQLFLTSGDPEKALEYFRKNSADYPDNAISMYNTAMAYSGLGDRENAVGHFLKALERMPSDSMLLAKIEDYLALNDYAAGHPLRVKFSEDHLIAAGNKIKNNLPDDALLHLNRSLFLNPVNRQAREKLRDIYQILDYYRLYLDEQKNLTELFSDRKYQDMLHLAVIKRRDRLYHRAGFSQEMPPRDVPRVLVLDFSSIEPVSIHPDAGELIGNYLAFTLSQFGRLSCPGIQKRMDVTRQLKNDRQLLGDDLEAISGLVREGKTEKPDFLVFGTYMEGANHISAEFELMDFASGVIINDFSLSESGKENLPNISVRAAKRIFETIPFKGRILSINDNEIIINLGLIDGIRKGDFMNIFKIDSANKKINLRKKITLEITDADTYLSSAKNKVENEKALIDINDTVYPYKKRRAKLIGQL